MIRRWNRGYLKKRVYYVASRRVRITCRRLTIFIRISHKSVRLAGGTCYLCGTMWCVLKIILRVSGDFSVKLVPIRRSRSREECRLIIKLWRPRGRGDVYRYLHIASWTSVSRNRKRNSDCKFLLSQAKS